MGLENGAFFGSETLFFEENIDPFGRVLEARNEKPEKNRSEIREKTGEKSEKNRRKNEVFLLR